MFKKRSRPTSVREKAHTEGEATPLASDTNRDEDNAKQGEENGEIGQNIEELILLRKLRRSKQGIDLERLNRGEDKKRKKKEGDVPEGFGLQKRGKDGDKDEEFEDDQERAKRLVRSNNFTQQTNALDVDKHMMAFIEAEMQKRRGQAAEASETGSSEAFDPQAELYKIVEKYEMQEKQRKDDEEGNVTNSLGMLTSIPEVDLGMDNRLRNIEMTERAKRDMLEQRKKDQAGRKRPEDEDYAAARFHRPNQRVASDIYAIEDAKRDAAGLPAQPRPPRTDVPRHESATDEQVYERFKKRMKR